MKDVVDVWCYAILDCNYVSVSMIHCHLLSYRSITVTGCCKSKHPQSTSISDLNQFANSFWTNQFKSIHDTSYIQIPHIVLSSSSSWTCLMWPK